MKNKLLKIISVCAALMIALSTFVFADCGTIFTVNYTDPDKDTVNISVSPDQKDGAGGLHLIATYDTSKWNLKSGSEKCGLKKGEVSASDGTVQLLWDTTDDYKMPDVIMSASFKKVSKSAEISDITFSVNDYYDNTVQMNDIPYQIEYKQTKDAKTARKPFNPVPAIIITLVVLALVGTFGYFYYKIYIAPKSSKH